MKKRSIFKNTYEWLNGRFQLDSLISFMKKKDVPLYRGTIWYFFGGITLLLFVIQVITGILLLLYYKASAELAFESVQFISAKVKFGWLIRSIHSWSANLMILSAFIHMFSVFFTKAYHRPRELTWYSGFILLVLGMGFGFTGYLLPWNELSLFATKVGTDIAKTFPLVGTFVMTFLRGGENVTGATLSRFFGFHVAVLPGIFIIFLSMHLIFIQRQGMAVPENWDEIPEGTKKHIPFFPNFLMRDLLIWLIIINVLAILAVFFPWELGKKADELAPAPAGIKPEWYFLFMFQTLKYLPAKVLFVDGELLGIFGFSVAALVWVAVPFLDRRIGFGRVTRFFTGLGVFALGYMIVLSLLALR